MPATLKVQVIACVPFVFDILSENSARIGSCDRCSLEIEAGTQAAKRW